jgi:GTP cyclohydrolase II
MHKVGSAEPGIVLYLRQEGRGIGLTNKLRAYGLQDLGYDTVEANEILGFADDEREYAVAAHMLSSLRVKSIRLMTNNPNKLAQLKRYGITISERVSHVIEANEHNEAYLETKAVKSGHLLNGHHAEQLLEQDDPPIVAPLAS